MPKPTAAELWKLIDDKKLLNPFHRTGVDDTARVGRDHPIVGVGLVDSALSTIAPGPSFDFDTSLHLLLLAPLGGGKSATLRRLSKACAKANGAPASVKLEKERFKKALVQDGAEACALEIIEAALPEFAKAIAKKKVKAGNATFEEAEQKAEAQFIKDLEDVAVPRLLAEIALSLKRQSIPGGLLLLDEAEALIADSEIPLDRRLQLLEVFKNWCEECDSLVSMVIAGTNAVLDLIRVHVPKVVNGRLTVVANFSLDADDVYEYLRQKITYGEQHAELEALLTEEAVELIVTASRGIPRRIERLTHAAWNLAQADDALIRREDVRRSITQLAISQIELKLAEARLTSLERRAAKKLAKHGLSTTACRNRFIGGEFRALRGISRRDGGTIVTRVERGVYEISDDILKAAFEGV